MTPHISNSQNKMYVMRSSETQRMLTLQLSNINRKCKPCEVKSAVVGFTSLQLAIKFSHLYHMFGTSAHMKPGEPVNVTQEANKYLYDWKPESKRIESLVVDSKARLLMFKALKPSDPRGPMRIPTSLHNPTEPWLIDTCSRDDFMLLPLNNCNLSIVVPQSLILESDEMVIFESQSINTWQTTS